MPWIGGAIAAGGSLLAGSMASDAASQAAGAQTAATDRSIAEQRRQYDTSRSDNAPFRNTGVAANTRLAQLLGLPTTTAAPSSPTRPWQSFYDDALGRAPQMAAQGQPQFSGNPVLNALWGGVHGQEAAPAGPDTGWARSEADRAYGEQQTAGQAASQAPATNPNDGSYGSLLRRFSTDDLNADPVYQSGLKFGLDRGTEGINARATANGMYDSGATLKALTQFGNDYGSTKANESYNRYTNDQNNTYNKLAGVSGSGQVATQQVTSAGTNMASNVGASLEGAGNARAAGIVGGANAWGSGITGAASGYNNYNNNQQLMALLRNMPNGGGYSQPSNFDYSGWSSAGGRQYGG